MTARIQPKHSFLYGKYIMQKSELTNGKGPNGLKEKVRIDQWRRFELTKRKVRMDQIIFLFEVRIDQLKRSELTSGRGPN